MRRDPPDRYEDLIVTAEEDHVSPDEVEPLKPTDTARSGWSAGTLAFDPHGRVLLVDD